MDAIVEPMRLFAEVAVDRCNQRLDVLLRNPRGFGRQIIWDVTVTGIDGQSMADDDLTDRPLQVRHNQKMTKYDRIADENGLQFIPIVFSHGALKRLIKEQYVSYYRY